MAQTIKYHPYSYVSVVKVRFYLKHLLPLFAKSGTNCFLFALLLHSSLRMTSMEMCLVNADFVILSRSTSETGSMSRNTYTLEYGLAVCITFEESKITLIICFH